MNKYIKRALLISKVVVHCVDPAGAPAIGGPLHVNKCRKEGPSEFQWVEVVEPCPRQSVESALG